MTLETILRLAISESEYRSVGRFAREVLGESRDWLYNRVTGRTEIEPMTIEKIRFSLDKPKDWPYSELPADRPLDKLPMAQIPVVGSAQAGPAESSADEQEPLWVPAHMARPDYRGFVIENDSMLPHLRPGDIAVIKRWKVPRLHRVNLIRSTNQEPRVKELRQKGGRIVAHSYSPAYADELFDGTVEGFLVGIYRVQGFREEMYIDPEGLEFRDIE